MIGPAGPRAAGGLAAPADPDATAGPDAVIALFGEPA